MRFSGNPGQGVRKMALDLSISESFSQEFRSTVSSRFWISGKRSMKTKARPTYSGLRLSVTACALLALLVGCAQQRESQARMDERFAKLMENDAGTSGG